MSTSGTYNFGSIQNEQIIREAYERVGIPTAILSQEKINTALRSINYILQSWLNKGLNLFTVQTGMLALNNGQSSYFLPNNGTDILEAALRTSTRNLGGAAFSFPDGVAENAFDGNPDTHCEQTIPDGLISYGWAQGLYTISMVGIMSFVDREYSLICEYYNGSTWNEARTIPRQSYGAKKLLWFSIPVPTPGNSFRVRETGGAILDISELYFNTNINDRVLTRSSRMEYIAYPDKFTPGTPTTFWVDRQIRPIVNMYPTPDGTYNNLFYSFIQQIQDAGTLIDTSSIPARFLDALTAELAYRISIKEEKLNILPVLAKEAEQSFALAAQEDTERGVPVRIYGDYRPWVQQ